MKQSTKWAISGGLALALVSAGFSYYINKPQSESFAVAEPNVVQENGQTVKEFTLTAAEKKITLQDGVTMTAWTYDGTAPGTQIRVTEGDVVRVTLKNDLPTATSIHWHGIPVPNPMDGIPGVTQNAVQPGQTFTYEFTATTPGTYWYHSHQNSAEQEDMGLYGSIIIEPKEQTVTYDRDVTLVLDEWQTGDGGMAGMDHGDSSGGGHSSMGHGTDSAQSEMSHDEMMKQMYDVFTVNGRAGDSILPVKVKQGERVKLRLINAGFQTHQLHFSGTTYRVTHADGQPISEPGDIRGQVLPIAPGERYDVAFTAAADSFWIDDHNDSKAASDLRIPVQVDGSKPAEFSETTQQHPLFDLAQYGKKAPAQLPAAYDKQYALTLNNVQGPNGELYTINGKVHPNIDPLYVKKGQWVKVAMTNVGTSDHPMHLHGHFFRVLTKNGQPITGGITEKDTINVEPGVTYEVAFQADNEGDWMFHCHDLHHAAAGMMTDVKYEGYKSNFVPDPSAGNIPE